MNAGKRYRVPSSPCPACGQVLDAARAEGDDTRAPRPGDGTVCGRCGALLIFGDDMRVRRLCVTDPDAGALAIQLLQLQRERGRL